MRTIRMIWDFRGGEAKGTAEHHAIHLNEFAIKHQLNNFEVGQKQLTEFHSIAFIDVKEEHLILLRDSLKPHRAQWVEK